MVLELKEGKWIQGAFFSSRLLIGCGVLRDASKMPKKFESWVITGPAMIGPIFSVLVLPSQNEKHRQEREAVFSTITAKAEKIKSIVPESYPILFKQEKDIKPFLLERGFSRKIHGI